MTPRAASEGDGAQPVVAVVGEALIDLVEIGNDGLFEALPGGSPANVAVGLARLDVPVRMVARIGDDPLGRRIRRHLAANAVDLSRVVAAREPSSLAIVAIGDDGRAEYDFRVDGTADWQWCGDELAAALDGPVIAVHSGSLALAMSPGADALRDALGSARPTATVSYDPNCRPLMGSRDELLMRVESVIELADVVKASSEDIEWLLPGMLAEQVVENWLARGPAVVAVTVGAGGVVAASRAAGCIRRPGWPVRAVDTIGAGDAFTSALLAGLYRRSLLGADARDELRDIDAGTLADVLDEAIVASALTCTRRGAEPPATVELTGFLQMARRGAAPG